MKCQPITLVKIENRPKDLLVESTLLQVSILYTGKLKDKWVQLHELLESY